MSGLWRWGAVALLSVAVGGREPNLPTFDAKSAQSLGHVTVLSTANADPKMVTALGEVCETAAAVYQQDLKLTPPADLRVCITPGKHAGVVTDRRSRIYVTYQPSERQFYLVTQWHDKEAPGPVHTLCRAVAELFNPHRIPGLEQLLASRYAVPAVLDLTGAKAWPNPYAIDQLDGEASFARHAEQPPWLREHPRWAAAVALGKAVDQLKPEAFAKTLAAVKGEGRPALAMLRKLLVAQVPAIEADFADYDQAVDWPLQPDGSLLLTSFETAAEAALLTHPYDATLAVTSEWATDGKRSARITFAARPWARVVRYDPDWRYADWSGFSKLEFDAHNPGDTPVVLNVQAGDDENNGHGEVIDGFAVPPKGQVHAVLSLLDPGKQAPVYGWETTFWDGTVRLDTISMFQFALPPQEMKGQVVVDVDHVRLVP